MCSGISSTARRCESRQCVRAPDDGAGPQSTEAAQPPDTRRSAPCITSKLRCRHVTRTAHCSCRRVRRTAHTRVRKRLRLALQRCGGPYAACTAVVADETHVASATKGLGKGLRSSAIPKTNGRWPRRVMAGTGPVTAHAMHDCTPLYRAGDWAALRTRLRLDGYLLLRNVLPQEAVLKVQLESGACPIPACTAVAPACSILTAPCPRWLICSIKVFCVLFNAGAGIFTGPAALLAAWGISPVVAVQGACPTEYSPRLFLHTSIFSSFGPSGSRHGRIWSVRG